MGVGVGVWVWVWVCISNGVLQSEGGTDCASTEGSASDSSVSTVSPYGVGTRWPLSSSIAAVRYPGNTVSKNWSTAKSAGPHGTTPQFRGGPTAASWYLAQRVVARHGRVNE